MSENRKDRDYLIDIQEAINSIVDYTKGLTYDDLIKDKKTRDAVVHNLEIIGEATKKLSSHLGNRNKHIPWKNIAGLRDRLIHHYFDINYGIVWNIVKMELPDLLLQIRAILTDD